MACNDQIDSVWLAKNGRQKVARLLSSMVGDILLLTNFIDYTFYRLHQCSKCTTPDIAQ